MFGAAVVVMELFQTSRKLSSVLDEIILETASCLSLVRSYILRHSTEQCPVRS